MTRSRCVVSLLYTDTSEGVPTMVLHGLTTVSRESPSSSVASDFPVIVDPNKSTNHPSPLSPVVASPFKSAWKRGDGKYAK